MAMQSASSIVKQHEAHLRKHGKMTMEHALKSMKSIPPEVTAVMKTKPKRHADQVLVVADASYGALDKARNVLNEMYDETQNELDIAVQDCTSYEKTVREQLDENTRMRTMMGEKIAKARADIADSTGVIEEAKDELSTLNSQYHEHQATCEETIKAAEEQIAILEADLAVGEKIKNMTKCDTAAVAAAQATSLMECSKGSGLKRQYRLSGHAGELSLLMKSKASRFSFDRMAKIALGRHLGRHRYSDRATALLQVSRTHHRLHKERTVVHKKHRKAALVQKADPANTTVATDSPSLQGFVNPVFYRSDDKSACSISGCLTISTKEACLEAANTISMNYTSVADVAAAQAATSPRGCSERAGTGLSFNNVETDDNVDGSAHNDKPICQCEQEEETVEDQQAREDDEPTKCSVGPKNCPRLYDAISTMVAEIADALHKLRVHLSTTTEYCNRVSTEYEANIRDTDAKLNENNVKLAEATQSLNVNEEGLRVKVAEFNTLDAELNDKLAECKQKYREAADTMCGIKTVRQELYQLQGTNPFMQDCEVSDWVPDECTVNCGGGTQVNRRTVVVEAVYGGACPPLEMTEPCNDHPCPIDCAMNDWSGWSACSKDCGGGVQQRTRNIEIESAHGGAVCGATQDSRQCNQHQCSGPCSLEDWSDWGDCSKACGGGLNFRRKYVATPLFGPDGTCEGENSPERVEERSCNPDECADNLVCNSKLDVIFCLDGSGSVGYWPYQEEKAFVKEAINKMNMGDNTGKAGLVRFSYYVDVKSSMTFDKTALENTVSWMSWPGYTTNTAEAVAKAASLLASGGRSDADSVIFVITDGMPDDSAAVDAATEAARQVARVIFVGVGPNLDYDALVSWASFPPELNVLHADDFTGLYNSLASMMADICPDLGCRETMSGRGQDYIGCQTETRGGKTCQGWTSWSPWAHWYRPWNYPNGNLGDHNYCRNPDGDSTIWCFTQDTGDVWDFCDPLGR